MSLLLALTGCITLRTMAPDLPCREAGYAIAARTEACSGDIELANARYDAFVDDYVCIDVDVTDPAFNGPALSPDDLFDCAFSIRELPCEWVDVFGDDLDLWLSVSDACPWVVARRDGVPLAPLQTTPSTEPFTGTVPTVPTVPTDTGGFPTTTPLDPPDACVELGGGGDRLVADGNGLPQGSEPRTIEAWLRSAPGEVAPMVAVAYGGTAGGQGFQLGMWEGQVLADWIGTSLNSDARVHDGALHHVAFTYDGVPGMARLYVDGVLDQQALVPLDTVLSGDLVMGNGVSGGADLPFVGGVGGVRLWSRALTDAEIDALRYEPPAVDAEGLLRWYVMEPQTGAYTVVANVAGNLGGTATVEGAPGFGSCE